MPTMHCRTSAQLENARNPRAEEATRPRRSDGSGAHRRRSNAAESRLRLRCDADAPAAARTAVRSLVGPRPNVVDAMLVASELVSNAVRHSGCTDGDLLTVMLKVTQGTLSITVVDPGRSGDRARPCPDPGARGGFGLRLVEQLAARWGSASADGHRVWAELPVAA